MQLVIEPVADSNATLRKGTPRIADSDLYERIETLCKDAENTLRADPTRGIALAYDIRDLLDDTEPGSFSLQYLLSRSHCLSLISHCHERVSNYTQAIEEGLASMRCAEEAERITENEDERQLVLKECANACCVLGNAFDRLGDFVASLAYRRQNLEILTALGNPKDRSHALEQVAAIYYRLADYPTALSCYQEAFSIARELGDLHMEGSALNGIGNIQYSQGRFSEAAESYRKGLSVFEALNDPYWQAGLLGNLSGAYLELGRLADARDCSLRSLVLRARIGDRHGQGYSHDCLGRIYLRMGRADKAREAALRSLSFFEEVSDRTGIVFASKTLAQACTASGEHNTALRHYRMALATAESLGLRDLYYQVCELLSELYEKMGDFACALEYYRKFHTAKEALFNEESDKKLRNLRALHEVEQAKREADIYRHHTEELEKANVRQAELLEQLKLKSGELERQARTDSLTGLMNRRHFELAFSDAFSESWGRKRPLTVAMIDIDHFKKVNDTCSHQVGDAALRALANLLQRDCRRGDLIARFGGEEFVLVLPGTDLEDALHLCERIRASVEAYDWAALHPEAKVTISIGLSADTKVPHPDKMLSLADSKLYEAKASGRNCIRS